MAAETCVLEVCFVPLDADSHRFFGFSEYLTSLALMVLAWTIADVRYRFRILTAPVPLRSASYWVIASVGVLALMTDLWRAEEWLVPQGNLLTPATWQALLGGLFLLTFLAWAWVAFIRPPIYGRRNAERFARTLYRFILKGEPGELAVVADEFARSAASLVRFAPDRGVWAGPNDDSSASELAAVEGFANDILLLIGDRRFCRIVVASAPGTALAVFGAVNDSERYGVPIGTFAQNIVQEALGNKDSFLYHETEGFRSGLIGELKPLSQAIFGNYRLVSTVRTILDSGSPLLDRWDAEQLDAYCRAVLLTLGDYVSDSRGGGAPELLWACRNIASATSDVYQLDGASGVTWDSDVLARLRTAVKFVKAAIEVQDKHELPADLVRRLRDRPRLHQQTVLDHLAELVFELILAASQVTAPRWECWVVQHNTVWSELFGGLGPDTLAGRVVRFKVRRMLYDEIKRMEEFPNFKGARVLRFCLNVMGLRQPSGHVYSETRPIHRVVLKWTQKNFMWLYEFNSEVGQACLVEGMQYDVEQRRLVQAWPAEGLRREPRYEYLPLEARAAPDAGSI